MRRLICISFVVLLIGCKDAEQSLVQNNSVSSEQQTKEEKPPALQLTIGNQVMKTYRGTYEWSYYDQTSNQMVSIQTDHAAPTQMVDITQGKKVNLTEPVHLKFIKDPQKYEVRLWDTEKVIATYDSFDEITVKGNYIVEIVSEWEQGRGTYVLALSIE